MPRLLLLLLPPRRLIAASCLALFALHSLLVDRPSTASLHPPQNDTNRCVGDAPESDVATKPAGAPRPPRATAASEGRAAREWKSIAFRTRFWGGRVWDKIFRRQILGECEEPRCHVAVDDSSSGGSADAIVFHANDLVDLRYGALPRQESPNQVFVFFSMEPPPLIKGIRWKYFKNFFNWTMTYRRDSDIVVPYGKVMKKLRRETRPNGNYVTQRELDSKTKKNKRAVWMVSHCITTAKREYFVKKLKRQADINIATSSGKKIGDVVKQIPIDRAHNKASVVYKIPCSACDRNYYGETGRGLARRISEHRADLQHHKTTNALVTHVGEYGHMPNFNEAEIIYQGMTKSIRKTLEAAQITQNSNINQRKGFIELATLTSKLATRDWPRASGGAGHNRGLNQSAAAPD